MDQVRPQQAERRRKDDRAFQIGQPAPHLTPSGGGPVPTPDRSKAPATGPTLKRVDRRRPVTEACYKWTAGCKIPGADQDQSIEDTGMPRKHHKPEGIAAKLRQFEVLAAQGKLVSKAVRGIGVTEPTYYRWRS
jgi:hypothetical protein